MNIYSRIKKKAYYFFYSEQWNIVLEQTPSGRQTVYQPSPDCFWADPFPIEYDNKLYLFFEELVAHKPGIISVFLINKETLAIERYYRDILKLNFHISYPFIFEHEGSYFMIPETNENRTVDIYKCVRWPDKWILQKNIMKDVVA